MDSLSTSSSIGKEPKTVNVNPAESNLSDVDLHLQRRILTPFLGKKVPPIPSQEERKLYPWHSLNIISRLFFWWLLPLMRVGYKRTLQPLDLWYLEESMQIEYYYARFARNLEKRISKPRLEHAKIIEAKKLDGTYNSEEDDEFEYPKYCVIWSLLETFKWEYGLSIAFIIVANCGFTLNPLLTKALINFVENRALNIENRIGRGIGYALGVSFMVLVSGMLINHFMHLSMMVGAKVKAVLTKAMLDKSFKLNAKAKQKFPAGKITSIMGTDLARIDLAVGFQPFVIGFPVPVAISILLLIVNIGVSALVGIGIFILAVGIIGGLTRNLFKFRKAAIKFTDMRVGYMKELLNNLKIIKFYSWEDSYSKTVANVRNKEMQTIFKMQTMRSSLTAFAISLPQLTSMISFLVMYAVAKNKSPGSIFSSLSLFNVLSTQIMMVPIALASGSDALIGVFRVTELLQSGEINELEQHLFHENLDELVKNNLSVKVNDANFEWRTFELDAEEVALLKLERLTNEVTEPSKSASDSINPSTTDVDDEKEKEETTVPFTGLHHVNLDIEIGEFVVITGMIGTGKSSLLNALAGFMHKSSGDVKINGSLLMCGQPWVQNATVKENILFGATYDEERYKDVIYACSLDADLDILPAGDNTEIGERGITLSGGQKLRINLARAVYADRDIILLDDVLSAVDARVGKHIMDYCMMGMLAQKTRILATHQLSLIGSANRVIFLNGDGTLDVGTVDELTARNDRFSVLMSYNADSKDEEEPFEEDELEGEEKELIRKQTIQDEEVRKNFGQRVGDGTLMSKEERAVNGISFLVYKRYIQLGSGIFKAGIIPLFLTAVVLTTFCQLFTNVWLSFWTQYKFDGRSNGFYIGLYVMFTILTMIFAFIQFTLIVYIANSAAKALNIKAVQRLIKLPMSFMDTTPMGRILNRFTKDTDSLDNEISEQFRLFIYPLANIVGVLILCIIYLPWFAIAIPFLVILFISISSLYQASGREVKRLELIQRSFVYNNFNETLSGLQTIKAYNQEERFITKNSYLTDKMNEAYFITIANQRWLAIHLDMVGCVLCLVISLLCVTRQFHIAAASVGLLLSYVLQITGQLSLLIRAMTQVENEMNSVERLCHYAFDLEQELPFVISETTPRPEWPENGVIDFNDVSLRYRDGLPLVLKNLTMHVGAGQKVGICGRTGAGKSSIMTALFRISELAGGSIVIDGVDISKIGLRDLRSKLSIIPQDPVLFRGSIRKNLDPFNEHSDEWLWESLKKAGLIDDISAVRAQKDDLHKFHLNQVVEDDGANFSLGERQLIALARAVVRDSKILILDEATSSVDYETDAKIQSTIVREFGHCTILCIAHRLKTIADYDRILVLDKGELREFDTPWNLFNLEGGIFQSMCERSNMTSDDFKRKN